MSWWIPQQPTNERTALLAPGAALAAAARENLARASWDGLMRVARLLRLLLVRLARASARLTRALELAADRLEAAAGEAGARACPLLPAELLLDDEESTAPAAPVVARRRPPPIPAEARYPLLVTVTGRLPASAHAA
jgi:hypothetical protein